VVYGEEALEVFEERAFTILLVVDVVVYVPVFKYNTVGERASGWIELTSGVIVTFIKHPELELYKVAICISTALFVCDANPRNPGVETASGVPSAVLTGAIWKTALL